MNKEIRVLTGFHSGAQIELGTTVMSIGAHAEADILINDWSEGPMQLQIDAQDNVTIGVPGGPGGPVSLREFEPCRFGDVVLCAGPAGARWPTDVKLMETMLAARRESRKYDGEQDDIVFPANTSPPVTLRSRAAPWARAGLAAVLIGSAGAAALALPAGTSELGPAGTAPTRTLADLQQALARLQADGVTVTQRAERFVVSGIAATAGNEQALRTSLTEVAGSHLTWNVKAADEIARALAESLHEPDLHVRYLGNATFRVSGTAQRPSTVRDVVERFRADMAPLEARFNVEVGRSDELRVSGTVDAALAVDGVRYVESSDGTKNFLANDAQNTTFH